MAHDEDFRIRLSRPDDEDAHYEICLRTGDHGSDATALFSDPRAVGNINVGPYLHLEPSLAFSLVDAEGVCGYVLGALDSAVFYERCAAEWYPPLRSAHPPPGGDPALWSPDERCYYRYHHPDVHIPRPEEAYPSHLHIDLLARARRQGNGTRMVARLIEELRKRGSNGVHLKVGDRNLGGIAFYRTIGFVELERAGGGIYMGRKIDW
jgi:ribosomal protein S18 acetylase RimI-like enzyme